MNDINKFVNNIILKNLIFIVIQMIIIIIFFKNFIPLILGLLVGGGLSIIFFRIIYLNLIQAMDSGVKGAKRIMTINYIVRYIISGLVLFVCAKSPYFNIFTCALGLISIKLTLYINNVYSLISGKKLL